MTDRPPLRITVDDLTSGIALALRILVAALAISVVSLFWYWAFTGSAHTFLHSGFHGDHEAGRPGAAGSVGGVVITVTAICGQALLIGMYMYTRTNGTRPDRFRRLPMPSESRPARYLYAAGVWSIGALTAPVIFNPHDSGPTAMASGMARHFEEIRAALAGAVEEPFFTMVPVLLAAALPARYVGRRLPIPAAVAVAIVVSALARGVIHLYEGPWPAAGAVFWGAGAAYAFYRYRVIVPLAIAHGLDNLAMDMRFYSETAYTCIHLGFAAVIAAFVVSVTRSGLRASDSGSPEHPPAAPGDAPIPMAG